MSVALMAVCAAAQSRPSQKRLDAIWDAVDLRLSKQTDIWFDDGDFPKSIHMLVFQAGYAPHDYDVWTNLGWMQENVEQWDAALATYKKFLTNNPHYEDRALPEADYLFRRGHEFELEHKPKDAQKFYKPIPGLLEPVLSAKSHPNNFRTLAHAYEKLRRLPDAVRIWKEYVAIAPADMPAKANLAKDEKKLAAVKPQ